MNIQTMLATVVLCLFAAPGSAAKINPVYEITALPEQQEEAELWESARKHEDRLRESGTVFENQQVKQYLESLSDRLLGESLDHLGIKLKLVLVAEPTLSGWVYPYGTIAMHTGLLVRMDNEAQFAAILAHEISHFTQRHTYREMLDGDKQSALGKGIGFLATIAAAKETGTFDKGIMDFTGDLWTNLATSGYSKKNEYVADEEGLLLMGRAGLAVDEAIPAFHALAENAVYGAADPRKMFSSHPRLEDRISNLEKYIKRTKRKKGYLPGAVPDAAVYNRGIAPALLINAKLDLREQQFERSREALTKLLSVDADNAEAHFLVGETYRRENPLGPDFATSLAAYQSALQEDPSFADAYREIGMANRMTGDTAAAQAAFRRYLDEAPDAPDAGIVRGYLEGL